MILTQTINNNQDKSYFIIVFSITGECLPTPLKTIEGESREREGSRFRLYDFMRVFF